MSLVTTKEVADYLQIDDTDDLIVSIETAEDLVSDMLGVDTLDPIVRSETIYLDRLTYNLPLRYGPVLEKGMVTSLKFAGEAEDLDDYILRTHWMLSKLQGYFVTNQKIEITYKSGVDTDNISSSTWRRLKRGIIVTAAHVYQNPASNVKQERIGDYSYQLKDSAGEIPDAGRKLISRFARAG